MRARGGTTTAGRARAVTVTFGLVLVVLALGGCADEGDGAPPADETEAAPGTAPAPEPQVEPEPRPEPDREPDTPDAPVDGDEVESEPPQLGAYGVSAGDAAAVDAGMRMLRDGGTAVDAAVAAAFTVSVVEPFASGPGGGGAALVVGKDVTAEAFDYREVVAEDGVIPASGTGIPGFVAGMEALHEHAGDLPWAQVVAPAIELADEGVATSGIVADQLRSAAYRLPTGALSAFYPGGSPLSEGDELVQPELADTLRTIADTGAAAFYEGPIASSLADDVVGIDTTSLANYAVQRSDPPRGPFADHEVIAAAPPLPGAPLIQLLQVAEALGIEESAPGSADYIHRLAMAWRVADRTTATELGDPDFVDVPVDELTDPASNDRIAAEVPDDRLLAMPAGPPSASNTTHISVVDEEGTVVSMTNTLTNFWGSGQHVGGFFLNDQLSRFSIGTGGANTPEAGRRSVSWSLPLVVADGQGRPVLSMGSPGGRRIPMIEANALVRWALHDQSLEEAVAAPRFHLEGGVLQFERLPPDDVAAELRARGYAGLEVPQPVYYFGSLQSLEIDHDTGMVRGARDARRAGDWAAGQAVGR